MALEGAATNIVVGGPSSKLRDVHGHLDASQGSLSTSQEDHLVPGGFSFRLHCARMGLIGKRRNIDRHAVHRLGCTGSGSVLAWYGLFAERRQLDSCACLRHFCSIPKPRKHMFRPGRALQLPLFVPVFSGLLERQQHLVCLRSDILGSLPLLVLKVAGWGRVARRRLRWSGSPGAGRNMLPKLYKLVTGGVSLHDRTDDQHHRAI